MFGHGQNPQRAYLFNVDISDREPDRVKNIVEYLQGLTVDSGKKELTLRFNMPEDDIITDYVEEWIIAKSNKDIRIQLMSSANQETGQYIFERCYPVGLPSFSLNYGEDGYVDLNVVLKFNNVELIKAE